MKNNIFRIIFFIIIILLFYLNPAVSDCKESLVKAKLIADRSVLTSGETFRLGVLFDIPEGYHIYWQNPGDSGLSTNIEWHIPDGFQISPISWPIPEKMEEPGGITVNVYEEEILLFTTVKTPKEYSLSSVSFQAHVDWLICKQFCKPESVELNLSLPFTTKPKTNLKASAVFDKYEHSVPKIPDEIQYLNSFAHWVSQKEDNNWEGEIRINSTDQDFTFIIDEDKIRWFDGPSYNFKTENFSLVHGQSNHQTLVLHLIVRHLGNRLKESPPFWGVLTFNMKNKETVRHALLVKLKKKMNSFNIYEFPH